MDRVDYNNLLLVNGWLRREDGKYEHAVDGRVVHRIDALKECIHIEDSSGTGCLLDPERIARARAGQIRHTPRRATLEELDKRSR